MTSEGHLKNICHRYSNAIYTKTSWVGFEITRDQMQLRKANRIIGNDPVAKEICILDRYTHYDEQECIQAYVLT
jgi:hypothetical protein